MKCARCEAEEDRINGFCSVYCEDMAEVELEVARLREALQQIADTSASPNSRDTARAALGEDA